MATGRGRVRAGGATLTDVARLAGVSVATASRVLNGSARTVRPDSEQRVKAAADKLGYLPNESAQSMVRGRTHNVGLVVRDIAEPYFAGIASGVIDELEAGGLHVTIAVTSNDHAREVEQIKMFRRQRATSVILVGSRSTNEAHAGELLSELIHFESAGGRVVMLSRHPFGFTSVLIDNREGAKTLAERLIGLGYREFTLVAGPSTFITAKDRVDGFRDGLTEHAALVGDLQMIESGFGWDGGFEAAERAAAAGTGPRRVVFAVNDLVALGLLAGWRRAGLHVPEDLALAGFDDIPWLRDVQPGLTTVVVPLAQAGRMAARLALAGEAQETVRVPTTVVIRESTPSYA